MKWLKRIGIVLGVIILILAVVPFFISLNDYIPQIEKEASARLKEPVSIKSIKFSALPLPHVTVDGITVGRTQDIKLGKVTVTPDLWSLLGTTKVIKSIEIDGLMLTQKGIDKIPAWTKPDAKPDTKPQQPAAVRVESIKLNDALVKLAKATVGPFDARLNLAGSGELEDAAIVTKDGKLKASVKPEKAKYRIDASAKAWRLPVGPAILFDELDIKGIATMNDANLDQVRAKLYGGAVNGRATIGWQKGLQLKGNFDINRMELKQLVPLLSPGTNVSGKLNAKPVFSASAASAEQLINALRLETPFNVQNGVLHGVDISKAATSLINKEGSKGGETRFDELSGHLVTDRGAYRLTQLKIASGLLSADGNVNISPRQELSGRINANVKAAAVASATVPLNVSGTVQSPLLLPTGATVTGAAVGTAILGPGIGTSVGMKAGQFVEKLFGGKEKKKP
ncbi:MAG: AsmA family protein [Betaproteobacteria bacterium]|nr:AsmA family protein [Betaproteobacteria bacterium]